MEIARAKRLRLVAVMVIVLVLACIAALSSQSLKGDLGQETRVQELIDFTSTRTIRRGLVLAITRIATGDPAYDINSDGKTDKEDRSAIIQFVRSFLGAVCGNGTRNAGEQCDDHNVAAGDGCSTICAIEAGFTCNGNAPSTCLASVTTCGNNVVDSGEQCDDGAQNGTANFFCSSQCRRIQLPSLCFTPAQQCNSPYSNYYQPGTHCMPDCREYHPFPQSCTAVVTQCQSTSQNQNLPVTLSYDAQGCPQNTCKAITGFLKNVKGQGAVGYYNLQTEVLTNLQFGTSNPAGYWPTIARGEATPVFMDLPASAVTSAFSATDDYRLVTMALNDGAGVVVYDLAEDELETIYSGPMNTASLISGDGTVVAYIKLIRSQSNGAIIGASLVTHNRATHAETETVLPFTVANGYQLEGISRDGTQVALTIYGQAPADAHMMYIFSQSTGQLKPIIPFQKSHNLYAANFQFNADFTFMSYELFTKENTDPYGGDLLSIRRHLVDLTTQQDRPLFVP